MTTRNPYVDLCLAVQAARRDLERVRTPLAPAMGVAASIYTHQIANTLRVLTDVRVRHLLADEVGLGKTVQALMIVNALRSERPDLRALIVVPDRLVPQWRDEILTRAHSAPIAEEDDVGEGQYIRLAWEAQLKMMNADGSPKWSLSDIDPENYDILVVDELHRLRSDLQDRIVRAAMGFEHVLILTATPAFQRVERHAQLFAILEPERASIARWHTALSDEGKHSELSVGDDLSKWPAWAAREAVDALLERDRLAAASCSARDDGREAAALAHCAYRRVIRTRRVDFSGVLPHRRHLPVLIEPLGAEVDRQALMWRYFGHLEDLGLRLDRNLLAKRVILSPPSLEQRVDFLRRKGHEREGLLEQVKPLVHRSQGDSRADALVDLLAEIWAHDPSDRVLVAAQDNLTVDYLFDLVQTRLPVIGPLDRRVPLVAARIRQGMMTEAVEDLGGSGNETNENLEAFQRGEAQVLFAPEAAQVGLNLQCARVLVLYSVPWRPVDVEQWIGRLDRIGNEAAFSAEGGAKSIDVYTIAQRGLVDEKVVTVLRRFRVFEHSVNLDGDHLDEVAHVIEAAALRPESVNWHDLENATEEMAVEDEVHELDSAVRSWLPWTVDSATSLRQHLDSMPPVPPVLVDLPEHSQVGPRSWDRAVEGMVKLLRNAAEYHIRWNTNPTGGSFRTLWYRFGDRGMYGQRHVQSKVVFSFGADPGHERSPRHAHAFITRRGDIGTPPRRSVTMTLDGDDVRRPLHFLSFGDSLHDELVSGWLPSDEGTPSLDVVLFEDHKFFERGVPGVYVLRLSRLDPSAVLTGRGVEQQALEAIARAGAHSRPDRLVDLLRPFTRKLRCALEADARWLRSQLVAGLQLDGARQTSAQWTVVDVEELTALMNPMAHSRNGVPRSAIWELSEADMASAADALAQLREANRSTAKSSWSHRFPAFDRALAVRRHTVAEESRDAESLAGHELRQAESKLDFARTHGNPAQITRAETARDAAADSREMTKALWEQRDAWLKDCGPAVRELAPEQYMTAVIRVRRVG